MARLNLIARALRRAAQEARREQNIFLRRGDSAAEAREMARQRFKNELRYELRDANINDDIVSLPNAAEQYFAPVSRTPFSPLAVHWEWDDLGFSSALRQGKRTRRQVAETMHAAMGEVGRRALTRFPRAYDFAGISSAHDRLYDRMARRLSPLYRTDGDYALTPTAAAYALYGGQQAARGAGLLGIINALTPAQAGEPE